MSDTIKYIKDQVPTSDEIEIERVFHEEKGDVVNTIIRLNELKSIVTEKQTTIFDDIRKILDEKDKVFQDKMNACKLT